MVSLQTGNISPTPCSYNSWLLTVEISHGQPQPATVRLQLRPTDWFGLLVLFYSLGTDIQKTPLSTAPVLLRVDSLLRKRVYSAFATNDRIENTASSTVAPVSNAADTNLSCRCLATAA
jgi:hypothetical protein